MGALSRADKGRFLDEMASLGGLSSYELESVLFEEQPEDEYRAQQTHDFLSPEVIETRHPGSLASSGGFVQSATSNTAPRWPASQCEYCYCSLSSMPAASQDLQMCAKCYPMHDHSMRNLQASSHLHATTYSKLDSFHLMSFGNRVAQTGSLLEETELEERSEPELEEGIAEPLHGLCQPFSAVSSSGLGSGIASIQLPATRASP